ncbi:MAG TPA: sulfurtransferase [Trueperaceae bacterium]
MKERPLRGNGAAARRARALIAWALLGLVLFAGRGIAQDYANPDLLVETSWLAGDLADSNLLIVDMREPADFARAHVPGAVNLPVSAIVATVDGVPFELAEGKVVAALRSIGLRSDHTVVTYDDMGMMNAARLFWTLEYLGHDDVCVLNGGWNAWVESGGPVQSGAASPTASDYSPTPVPERLVTKEELADRLADPDLVIADARSREEYLGEFTFSGRAGRIPGAVHLPWFDALTGGDVVPTTQPGWQAELSDPDVERMKGAEELAVWLADAGLGPEQEVVTYCQTLWRGAHLYFVLRLMGYENVRGYDGSWAEWSLTDLPIETGEPR